MQYPVNLERDGDGWLVSFPDIPEALTGADTQEEALTEAQDALLTAFEFYFEDNRPIPLPSLLKAGQESIEVPLSVWSKVLLLNALCETHVSQAELARRLNIPRQNVQRLIDLRHTTKLDALASAITALGRRLELRLS